jgi:glycosyltransferase involved in cell wall biosynthesis
MKVTIIVPARNEEEYIEKCIRSLIENASKEISLEILVVDGMSQDGTQDIVRGISAGKVAIKLIENQERTTPKALNIGIAESSGDVLFFIGAHAMIGQDYIALCLALLEAHPEAWCAGGSIRTLSDTNHGKGIAEAMSSPFGVGNAQFRLSGYHGYVDTLTFGAYPRWVFSKVGTFDETLIRNQDDDLNLRILKAGGKIVMNGNIVADYYSRSDFGKLFRQYYQYGYWRSRTLAKHHRVASLRQLVPAAFTFVLVVGGIISIFDPLCRTIYFWFLASYLAFLITGMVAVFRKSGKIAAVMALPAFVILHSSYGIGFWSGMYSLLFRRPSTERTMNLTR